MKERIIILLIGLLLGNLLKAQPTSTLSLQEAYTLLENHYPSLENAQLLEQIYQQELQQLDLLKKPSLFFRADGRFQSESTKLDTEGAPLPFEINQPLFSVKPYVEARYQILDGGMNEVQKKLKGVQLQAQQQNIEVDKFALRERINQLFFGITLLRAQSKLLDISIKDLEIRKTLVGAKVENGILLESELTKIEVQQIELQSNLSNMDFQITGFINTLSFLINQPLDKNVELVFPPINTSQDPPTISRPEQQFFKLQRAAILAQSEMIDVQKKPMLSAYAQAGVGYPNPVNILDNNIAPFGILGVQFNWQITDWKKGKVDKQILSLEAEKLQHAEDAFFFNMESKESQYLAKVNRLLNQIEQDQKIVDLQGKILEQLAAQLEEGIITSSEYLTQVNIELRSRQNLIIHQTELLQSHIEFYSDRGAF